MMSKSRFNEPAGLVADTERLLQEIAYMEGRLAEIGHEGDCAYEKAIARFFEQQVADRKGQLGIA